MSDEIDLGPRWEQIDTESYHSRLVIIEPMSDCCDAAPTTTISESGVAVCSYCGITRGVDEWHNKDGAIN